MGLEAATTIAELVITNPDGDDKLNQGDNHIRMVKDVLQLIFPGSGGIGFAKPITATEDELNFLAGITSNINDDLDALGVRITANEDAIANLIETGTKMMFYQAAAPTGWTIDSTVTDNMLRIVDGTILAGGAAGGTDDPVLNDKVPTHTHPFTTNDDGAHTHIVNPAKYYEGTGSNVWPGGNGPMGTGNHNFETTSTTHQHAGTTDSNGSPSDWVPRFANVILCTKD